MTEAGWGTPGWLPAVTRRWQYLEEQAERREAREAERERAARLERRHEEAVTAAVAAAELRGEFVGAVDRLSGDVGRRSVEQILEAARLAADRDDAIAVARATREGAQPVHIEVGEPRIVSSPVKRSILNRSRRWLDWQEKRRAAEAAEDRHRDDFPLQRAVRLRA